MLGGNLLSSVLLFQQEFFEMGGGEGERLPTETHQVGVLKPGVTEAIFDRGTSPVDDQTARMQTLMHFRQRRFPPWCSDPILSN